MMRKVGHSRLIFQISRYFKVLYYAKLGYVTDTKGTLSPERQIVSYISIFFSCLYIKLGKNYSPIDLALP